MRGHVLKNSKEMHGNVKVLIGQKFGRLTVIKDSEKRQVNGNIMWLCECLCGNLTKVDSRNLQAGRTRSCGCLQSEEATVRMRELGSRQNGAEHPGYKHGDGGNYCKVRLYSTWKSMKERCGNPNAKSYKFYGKKGITVCDSWLSDYMVFRDWAYDNGYNDTLCIDRLDNDDGYYPGNCQFLTKAENARKAWRQRKEATI